MITQLYPAERQNKPTHHSPKFNLSQCATTACKTMRFRRHRNRFIATRESQCMQGSLVVGKERCNQKSIEGVSKECWECYVNSAEKYNFPSTQLVRGCWEIITCWNTALCMAVENQQYNQELQAIYFPCCQRNICCRISPSAGEISELCYKYKLEYAKNSLQILSKNIWHIHNDLVNINVYKKPSDLIFLWAH